ncbi:GAP family protein [Kocuria sp.]|uniref:GAP family protein n=1 Tax=Kocuria sp. TaxID=1871328 RepID=UPI0026E0F430|nr:GAP family protein [Kocuria sp.]MDO5619110.1 GAP family protein [Kocuria sp.]
MEFFTDLTAAISATDAATLTVLALVDATSTGTLVIPLLLLLFMPAARLAVPGADQQAPTGVSPTASPAQVRSGGVLPRVLAYLAMVATFYWGLGIVLLLGAGLAWGGLGEFFSSRGGGIALVALGIGLVVLSWWIDPKTIRNRGGDPEAGTRRWVGRAQNAIRSWPGLVGLALAAGVLEVATMLPYLAAIGGLVQADLSTIQAATVLAVYCVIMVAPALLLCLARWCLGARLDIPVARLRDWAIRSTPTTLAWVVGIVGVLIVVRTLPGVLNG